ELERAGERPLPPPRPLQDLMLTKLQGCGPATRQLLDAAAVLGVRSRFSDVVRVAEVEEPRAALDEAVRAGLLAWQYEPPRTELRFQHPLIAAAVYHALPLQRRSLLHTAAAAAVQDEALALQHEAAAHDSPDPELAA